MAKGSVIIEQAFFELLKGGLWGKDVRLSQLGSIDYIEIYKMAEGQTVLGLITAGLEKVSDAHLKKENVLLFIGNALQLEQSNLAMNNFIAAMTNRLHEAGIHTVLVKGQGIAQCYERPLWRACGDVDFLLDSLNYEKAKSFFIPIASNIDKEDKHEIHLGMTISSWVVELHGSMRSCCLPKMDKIIDEVQLDMFRNNEYRIWHLDTTEVLLPNPDNDVFFVFTHILKHFFKGELGLRQLCDWCRLLWTFKDELDLELLKRRLIDAGIMTEWKVFAAFSVDYLGMPDNMMPFYVSDSKWGEKAKRVKFFIMGTGNFGHNRDNSHLSIKVPFIRKSIIAWKHFIDSIRIFPVFPLDSIWSYLFFLSNGISGMIKK